MRSSVELADIITSHLSDLDPEKLTAHHLKTLGAISKCRTAELGGHVDSCDQCGHLQISYNSCRNRHCPKCQRINKESWVIMQEDMLLPVAYFHVVFTLPHELNGLCMHNPKQMYDLLFKSAWHTIKTLSSDPKWLGAKPAATMLLHTWSQTLGLHPHLHCIVPNGGINQSGQWVFPKRGKSNFLYPVNAMKKIFKGYFMQHLLELIRAKQLVTPKHILACPYILRKTLYEKQWVVFTKKPFSGVQHVVGYLARYSHRVAIVNRRILDLKNGQVTFTYKDYKQGAKSKIMCLQAEEFLRRFSLHILPHGFRKVRQFGFTSNASKKKFINLARQALEVKTTKLLDAKQRNKLALARVFNGQEHKCPACNKGAMIIRDTWTANKSPPNLIIKTQPTKYEFECLN